MDQSFMKTKKVVPLVASMALPMALSMLVNALYNIVDSFFIAQISEKAMTALSLIFPLQNVTTAVGVGLGVGTNAAVAFFLGGERKQEAQRAASAALLLSLVNTAILMAVLLPLRMHRFSITVSVTGASCSSLSLWGRPGWSTRSCFRRWGVCGSPWRV